MARPKRTNLAVVAGAAAVGAWLSGPLGAIIGTGFGKVLGEETLSLEDALRGALATAGFELVSVRATSQTSVAILFKAGGGYQTIYAAALPGAPNADDVIYDNAVAQLAAFGGG